MLADVSPRRIAAQPGRVITLAVTIRNTGDIISGHRIRVLGLDPAWVTVDREHLSLFPGTATTVLVKVKLPPGTPAGDRRVTVQVRELTPPAATAVLDVDLQVPPAVDLDMQVDPRTVLGGRRRPFTLLLRNSGNTPVTGSLVGTDAEERLVFQFTPPTVELGPGEHAAVEGVVRGRRRFMGQPVVRPFVVRLDDGGDPEESPSGQGSFMQRPVVARSALSLGGLLAAVSVFAVVITLALSGVVGRSAADRNLALQVAQGQQQSTGGNSAIAGTVRLLTSGDPVAGVTVQVFTAADTATPVTSSATDSAGGYRLGGLAPGSYKLEFRGAGFAELWYPDSLTPDNATTVNLLTGQTDNGVNVRLGGLPASISGTVTGPSPAGATVTLELASGSSAGSAGAGAVLQTTSTGADGSFALADVPSPSVYDVVVTKPGFATETQLVDVGGGENRSGITIELPQGDGLISGQVNSTTGPLGGATITATYGSTTVQTVSLTQGHVGAFTLRNLPTPATFSIVVSESGLADQTLSLSLSQAQQLTGVSVTLAGASASLAGLVTTAADGQPASGVTVTVTNGSLTVSTVTASTGSVGSWTVAGLPVPDIYTVTFSRADLASQTVSVGLNAFGAVASSSVTDSASAVDASLQSATAVLQGITSQQGNGGGAPSPTGEVSISLTSSGATFQVTSASVPAGELGHYEVDRIPPGTYTVSVSRPGSLTTSTIITLAAGDVHTYDPVIAQPASIAGTISDSNGHPLSGAVVQLFLAANYPNTPTASTTTDSSGHYSFPTVDAPQNYVVEFSYPSVGSPQASATITVNESQAVTVNLSEPAAPSGVAPSASPGG